MKIGVDARSLLGDRPRGEGKALLRLYTEIALLQPNWKFVFFGVSPGAGAQLLTDRIPHAQTVYFDPPGFRWNSWENFALPLQCLRQHVSLLHAFSSGGPKWCPVPMVLTVHDVIPLLFDDGWTAASVERFRLRLGNGLAQARSIVAVSENTQADILKKFPLVRADRMHVIPWGAPDLLPACNLDGLVVRQPVRKSLGELRRVLVFGGGGAKRKNTAGTLDMFVHVAAACASAVLTFVGVTDAVERARIDEQAQFLGIADRIELRGFLSQAQLDELLASADCLAYLSLYEGFGLPPLEAMALGIPVVASNTSSLPEVVGDAGLLVDPTDALAAARAVLSILNDADLRDRLVLKSLARAKQFNWRTTAHETALILKNAIDLR